MRKAYTCICCPIGCTMEVEIVNGEMVRVRGNRCIKGKEWIIDELKEPKRTLITVIRVKNGILPTISVKTSSPIPKRKIQELIKILAHMEIEAPVHVGDVILNHPLNIDTQIIATRDA